MLEDLVVNHVKQEHEEERCDDDDKQRLGPMIMRLRRRPLQAEGRGRLEVGVGKGVVQPGGGEI